MMTRAIAATTTSVIICAALMPSRYCSTRIAIVLHPQFEHGPILDGSYAGHEAMWGLRSQKGS